MSLNLKGGAKAAEAMIREMGMISLVPSLAGVATSVRSHAKTSHRAYSSAQLAAMGISAGQLRFSIGLEDVDDIIAELARSLDALE